jgi:hypothetical protein
MKSESRSCLKKCGIADWIRRRARPETPTQGLCPSVNGAYVPPYGNALTRRIASFLDQFSASRFPYRFPRLHGFYLEFRSFRHRIALVYKQGESRRLKTYPVFQDQNDPADYVWNKQTLARMYDTQHLFEGSPWLSAEDLYLFQLGWDAGWESHANNQENTGASEGNKYSSELEAYGAAMLRRA